MRNLFTVILCTLLLSSVGCTTYSNNHYALMDAPSKEEISAVKDNIQRVIEPVLTRYGLKEQMYANMPDGVLLYYTTGGDSAIRIGFRVQNNKVIFDSFQYRAGSGDSKEYIQVVKEILEALHTLEYFEIVEVDGPAT